MKSRNSSFFLTLLIVLTLSMMWTVPVLADEGAPQGEEPAATETAPVEEPAADESEPVIEEPAPSDGEVAPAPEGETLLEQLPENTTVVVVDENGDPLPLVTQEAAEAVATMPDPRWCPVGAVPGAVTCSPAFSKFNGTGGLIEWLTTNNPGVAGVIWVEAAYDSSVAGDTTAIILDGGVLTNMANVALTINGGWAGGASTILNPNDQSEFNVPFHIVNWTGAVTLNNLLVTGASGSTEALKVATKGNITVNNVDVLNNTVTNSGAWLQNAPPTTATGNVIVNDSTFNGNVNGTGLRIYSNGTVTIKNVTANENSGTGLYVRNDTAATPKAVTLTGSNQFMHNGVSVSGNGLQIISKGLITLSNLTAEGNSKSGVDLQNNATGSTAGVIIKGANSFSNNGWDGLKIYTNGAVMLSNITANGNGTDPGRSAANLIVGYDAAGKGAIIVNKSASPKPVTLTGVNTFNNNASSGLMIDTAGLLTISNLTANNNGCDSLYDTDDSYCAGAYLQGAGVTLTGYGNFTGNTMAGLRAKNAFVTSASSYVGALTLSNLYAEGNGDMGVWLNTESTNLQPYNVTLLGVNTILNNGYDGLQIYSNGVVSLSNITANENALYGVYVNNTSAISAKAVIFNGAGTYNNNGDIGLKVNSYGAITTNGLTVVNNGSTGVELDNCLQDPGGDCDAFAGQAVTMNGINTFMGNASDGLFVISRGAVTISNVTSTFNYAGVYIDNYYNNSAGGVTFKNYLNSSMNGSYGAVVYSRGAITMANVRADLNGESGLSIYNDDNTAVQVNVTISGTNSFSGNGDTLIGIGSGLTIYSYGAILLNNVYANGNVEYGAYIRNSGGVQPRNITLTGVNYFNDNLLNGLDVESYGAVVLNKTIANFNNLGVAVNNQFDLFSQPVTIAGYGIFNDNIGDGLNIRTNGNVTLANLTANNNGSDGLDLVNRSVIGPLTTALSVNVTLTGVNMFNGNTRNGAVILSDGVISLNSVTASYNLLNGLSVDNTSGIGGSTGKGFTLSGWNTFIGNANNGLLADISGNIVLSRVVSSYNRDAGGYSGSGINVFSNGGSITITCASLNGNEGYGYNLSAPLGTITLKGVYSFGNGSVDVATGTPLITRSCPLP